MSMKETIRRRKTVTSSLNEISTDQLGKRVVARGGRRFSGRPPPLFYKYSRFLDRYFKMT
jgi:hypothetical protein